MHLSALALCLLPLLSLTAASDYVLHLNGSNDPSPFTSDVDDRVSKALKFYNVPGVAIAVLGPNSTFARGYGISKFPNTSVTPETLFFTGSTTKAFTAAALSLLVDQNSTTNVTWTTPLHKLLPDDFALMDAYASANATVEDAASHRIGIPDNSMLTSLRIFTPQQLTRALRYLPLSAPIRTLYQYTNLFFITLGYVIEKVTGQPAEQFLKEKLWTPLNMTSTYWTEAEAVASGKAMAQGYLNVPGNSSLIPSTNPADNIYFGAGGAIISNVIDYSKWIRMMMTGGAPLSAQGHQQLIFPRTIVSATVGGEFITYALGWLNYQSRGYTVITHDGIVPGYAANVLYIPELQFGVAMMANSLSAPDMLQALSWGFVYELLKTPVAAQNNYTEIWLNKLKQKAASRNVTSVASTFPDYGKTPPSLPLDKYTGNYTNGAYGTASILNKNGTLYFYLGQGNPLILNQKMAHITADEFLAYGSLSIAPTDTSYIPMAFQVNATASGNTTTRFGAAIDPAYITDPVWFDKVE